MDTEQSSSAWVPPREELSHWADEHRPLAHKTIFVADVRLPEREEDPLLPGYLLPPPVPEEIRLSQEQEQQQRTSSRQERHVAIEELFARLLEERRGLLKQWREMRRALILKDALAERIFALLLEAWTRRLGCRTPGGWTRYSRKTSTRACLTLRELMEKGDPDTEMPVAKFSTLEKWEKKVDGVKWWFDTAEDAIDFLSFLGRGANRFGQQDVRVDAAKYLDRETSACVSPDHKQAMAEYYFSHSGSSYNPKPQVDPCACVDQIRLLQILCDRQGLKHTGWKHVMEQYVKKMLEKWTRMNEGVEIEAEVQPLVARIEGREFTVLYWEKVVGEGEGEMQVVGWRVEGPVAELL